MTTLLDNLRSVLGQADFYVNDSWDYAAMLEYLVGAIVLCIVITSVFRFLGKLVSR